MLSVGNTSSSLAAAAAAASQHPSIMSSLAIHPSALCHPPPLASRQAELPPAQIDSLCNLLRWFDLMQHLTADAASGSGAAATFPFVTLPLPAYVPPPPPPPPAAAAAAASAASSATAVSSGKSSAPAAATDAAAQQVRLLAWDAQWPWGCVPPPPHTHP